MKPPFTDHTLPNHLNIVSVCISYGGYGDVLRHVVRGLVARGVHVTVRPLQPVAEHFGVKLDRLIKRAIVRQVQPDPIELLICPPMTSPTAGKRTIYFTMWETDRLPEQCVTYLNRAELVLTPSKWGAGVFKASGVTVPSKVVNLGIDPKVFNVQPVSRPATPIVFGCGGRLAHGGVRKGVAQVVSMFEHCVVPYFDPGTCELHVKCFTDCKLPETTHPAIKFFKDYLTDEEMADWYRGLDMFVSAASGEGWGLFQHQSQACGVPVITPIHTALTEFCVDGVNTIAVDHVLHKPPTNSFYDGHGRWTGKLARPDIGQMAGVMTAIVEDGQTGFDRQTVSESVSGLTWDRTVDGVIEAVQQLNL